MRDIALTLLVAGILPFTLKRPSVGLALWIWLSIMNPHRLTYGFAFSLPFAEISAAFLFTSILVNWKDTYRFPWNGLTVSLIAFLLWTCVSPWFSFHPEFEFDLWVRVFKILLMVLVGFLVVGNRKELNLIVIVLAISVAFYGVKGGLFTIATGGGNRVWGPSETFIGDNNTLALALVMTIPLLRYIQIEYSNRWIKSACLVAMALCAISVLGSQSRGAFLAIGAISVFLWWKSPKKLVFGLFMVAAAIAFLSFMPSSWYDRMHSISDYQDDGSAMGRINAWWVAWNLATSRFPIGGGFKMWTPDVFAAYAPNPNDIHVAHSIYFQVLGEHGFMGLFLFLAIFLLAWRYGNQIIRLSRDNIELDWARNMAAMIQVSLIGYAVGGAFLSLSYYDFPYYLALVLVVLKGIVNEKAVAAVSRESNKPPSIQAKLT